MIKLKFGKAHNGWLPVELKVGDHALHFDASYLPTDFVVELVAALSGVLQGPGQYLARLCEEPSESDWTFCRTQDVVVFSVVQYPSHTRRRSQGKTLVQWSGRHLSVVLPLWRGLQELGSRRLRDNYKTHWGAAFPAKELERLTKSVRWAKQDRNKETGPE